MEFTADLWEKAKSLGFPNAKCIAVIEYNENNSILVKKHGCPKSTQNYKISDIVDRGVLIGPNGHFQLIEWRYIKDIY